MVRLESFWFRRKLCLLFIREATRINSKTGRYLYPAGLYGLLLLYTGMRIGEALALKYRDVDFEHGLLRIEKSASMAKNREKHAYRKQVLIDGTTKNSKARTIQLKPEALEVLIRIRKAAADKSPDAYILTTTTGRRNTTTNMEHRMRVIFHNAGLEEYTGALHLFRRTFATTMYNAGARVEEIAAHIGDLESTTRRYYIAIRKKMNVGDTERQVVPLPGAIRKNRKE